MLLRDRGHQRGVELGPYPLELLARIDPPTTQPRSPQIATGPHGDQTSQPTKQTDPPRLRL